MQSLLALVSLIRCVLLVEPRLNPDWRKLESEHLLCGTLHVLPEMNAGPCLSRGAQHLYRCVDTSPVGYHPPQRWEER